jgi:type II secretory pathway component GspD/PulD (secretin)
MGIEMTKKILFGWVVLSLIIVSSAWGVLVSENDAAAGQQTGQVQTQDNGAPAGMASDQPPQPSEPPNQPPEPNADISGQPYPNQNQQYQEPTYEQEQPPEQGQPSGQEATDEISKGINIDSQQRISLDLKGIDIIELFRILSMKMGVTIVPTKSVAGRVNIFLNNLTFDDALEVILVSQDLACDKKGGIINIMTSTEYTQLYGKKYNEKREIRTLKLTNAKPQTVFNALSQVKSDIGKLIVDESTGTIMMIDIPEKLDLMEKTTKDLDQPLETEVFDIKYAKSADVKTHLSSAITSGPGELFVDDRAGKIVVTDLPQKMKKIKRIVKAIDEPTPQVFIEAEILQLTLSKDYQRDIDWEKSFEERKAHGLDYTGTFPANPSFEPSQALSAANLQMVIGTLARDNYTATVNWLESFGEAKILSRPRIACINNQEAKVLVGTREAYITTTQSQAETTTITSESVQFIDVGVKLSILPTINKDGFVTIKIKPEVSSVGDTITTEAGSRVPIVSTSEAETTVKVKDGSMVMIAGLMENTKRDDVGGIPVLSRIPVVGALFGSKANLKKRTELIVFLTPHIFEGDTSMPETNLAEAIPADMVPPDMQKALIKKEVGAIKTPSKEKSFEEKIASKDITSAKDIEKDMTVDLEKKMKGLKAY